MTARVGRGHLETLQRLWDLATGAQLHALHGHNAPVGDAEADWEGERALSWTLECNGTLLVPWLLPIPLYSFLP